MFNSFKKILAGILLLTLFLNTNYALMYYGVFKMNQKFLAEELCEKKVDACNACCYLNKKIDEESGDAKASAPNVKVKEKLSEYTVNNFLLTISNTTSSYLFYNISSDISIGYISLPGKPPQFS